RGPAVQGRAAGLAGRTAAPRTGRVPADRGHAHHAAQQRHRHHRGRALAHRAMVPRWRPHRLMPHHRPMPRQFDLIAFDWDGTLYDSTAVIARCIQLAVADIGGTVPTREQASYVIGMGLMQALAHAAPDVPPEQYPRLGERYRHHYLAHQNDLSLFEGVLPMLAELKARHHWLAVATGKSRR